MQPENLMREAVAASVELPLGPPVDPHPAIDAPPSTAMAIQSGREREIRIVLMAPRCTWTAVTRA
jgi:hypothetical protein